MSLDDGPVFFVRPSLFLDVRVEVVMPALSTLLANPTWKMFGDISPIFGSVLHDQTHD